MNFFTKKDRGFTLIELLVVIAIIGILSSVVLASLNSAREKSRDARRIGDIKQLQLALEMYYDSNNGYPSTTAALVPSYIPVEPSDPQTSAAYTYEVSGTSNYVLRTTLESSHSALGSDIDGTPLSTTLCDDAVAPFYYCVQP
ncbi:type II secretion system protein [Candidatus Kaiserbacteria bacterium]|nr:MAG: type II secretion system protein [Candidatus Kaiserbacteria bacterium]